MVGIPKFLGLFLLPLFGHLTRGQDTLGSFDLLKDALFEGSLVQIYASSASCSNHLGLYSDRDVSMPMKQWRYSASTSEIIEVFDYYVTPIEPDASMMWILRSLRIARDGEGAVVHFKMESIGDYGDFPIETLATMDCRLGDSANFLRVIPASILESVNTFEEMQSAYLSGDDIKAIGHLTDCSNAGDFLPDLESFVVGFHPLIFDVNGDGTDQAIILFDDLPTLHISDDGEQTVYDTFHQVIANADGTATVRTTQFNFDFDVMANYTLNCDIGSSLKFAVHQKETPEILEDYQDIKAAALNGYDIEVSSLLHFCEAPGPEGVIVTAKSTHFEFVAGGTDIDEHRERIIFHAWGLDADATLYSNKLTFYEDNIMFFEAFAVAPGAGPEGLVMFPLVCPLKEGARAQAIPRTRGIRMTDLAEMQEAIVMEGQNFEIVIKFDGCQLDNNYMAGRVVGGVGWYTMLKTDDAPRNQYMAHIFAIVTYLLDESTSLRSPAHDVVRITVSDEHPGTVLIQKGLYDWYTGENILGEGDGVITCTLGEGSVEIYEYP